MYFPDTVFFVKPQSYCTLGVILGTLLGSFKYWSSPQCRPMSCVKCRPRGVWITELEGLSAQWCNPIDADWLVCSYYGSKRLASRITFPDWRSTHHLGNVRCPDATTNYIKILYSGKYRRDQCKYWWRHRICCNRGLLDRIYAISAVYRPLLTLSSAM